MEPTEWRKGRDLTAQLDASVPDDLRIPVPDRPDTFQPMPPTQLAATASIRFVGTVPGQIVLAAICFLLGVITLSGGHAIVGGGLVLATLCLAARVVLFLRRLPTSTADRDEPSPA
jgi:hypothetical protein